MSDAGLADAGFERHRQVAAGAEVLTRVREVVGVHNTVGDGPDGDREAVDRRTGQCRPTEGRDIIFLEDVPYLTAEGPSQNDGPVDLRPVFRSTLFDTADGSPAQTGVLGQFGD